jgi:hypothetical protein
MNEITNYLMAINISEPIKKRIIEIVDISKAFSLEEQIDDIFISEYKTEDKRREFESIWIFTKTYVMEAKKFRIANEIDIINRLRGFDYLTINFDEYDYINNKSKKNSKMSMRAQSIESEMSCVLKASGNNCEYLKNILEKYFRNIK